MQKLHIPPQRALDLELVHVQGMNFIPLADIVVPIPEIRTSGSEQIISARINIPVIDRVPFVMTDGVKRKIEEALGDGIVFGREELFTVPKNLRVDINDYSLEELAAAFAFHVRLCWKNEMLGFEILKGRQRKFVGLDQLL